MKKGDLAIYAFIILVTILLIVLMIVRKGEIIKQKENNSYNYNDLNNYNDYYTVLTCAKRYVYTLEEKNVDSLLKIYDEEFIERNKITKDNVLDFSLDLKTLSYEYVMESISVAIVSNDVKKYKLTGHVEPYVDEDIKPEDTSFYPLNIYVTVDEYTNTYSIIPIMDGDK